MLLDNCLTAHIFLKKFQEQILCLVLKYFYLELLTLLTNKERIRQINEDNIKNALLVLTILIIKNIQDQNFVLPNLYSLEIILSRAEHLVLPGSQIFIVAAQPYFVHQEELIMCEYAEMVSFVHNIIRLDSRKQYWTRCHHIGLNDERILLPFFGMTNNVV